MKFQGEVPKPYLVIAGEVALCVASEVGCTTQRIIGRVEIHEVASIGRDGIKLSVLDPRLLKRLASGSEAMGLHDGWLGVTSNRDIKFAFPGNSMKSVITSFVQIDEPCSYGQGVLNPMLFTDPIKVFVVVLSGVFLEQSDNRFGVFLDNVVSKYQVKNNV